MNSTTKLKLAISLPIGILTLMMAAGGWWSYQEIEILSRRLTDTNTAVREVASANAALKEQLTQAEGRIAAGAQDISNTRSALLQAQRSAYDHEKMLSTIFTIQRSGDSLVAFKRSEKQQAFSMTISQ